ncbi:Uncharacterised protein [Yersinia mollaretii]|uniref:Uncharacterized protein n=1 Tax=Yersinia mollaretii TaxID=33060 RepID=A0AA36PI64_YERMO|nr:Uncharacterised protein [Yersinia mollaretii]
MPEKMRKTIYITQNNIHRTPINRVYEIGNNCS